MKLNYLIVMSSSLIPLVIGMLWYSKIGFGKVWMQETGITEEQAKSMNMIKVIGLSMLFNIFVAMLLPNIVIHQTGLMSALMNESGFNEPTSELGMFLQDFMTKYGTNFRTFKHGAFHGFLTSILFVLPIVGTSALYEMKSFKYIFIHVGYWAVSLMLMGGVICAFA